MAQLAQYEASVWSDFVYWWNLTLQPSGSVVWAAVQWWRSVGWERGCWLLRHELSAVDAAVLHKLRRIPAPEPSEQRRRQMLARLAEELSSWPSDRCHEIDAWQAWWRGQTQGSVPWCWTSIIDTLYPPSLYQIADPPAVVWWYGACPRPDVWQRRCLAVVGSRHATAYGKQATQVFVKELVQRYQCVIVSGGAHGIDMSAHDTARQQGGATVVVLPSGVGAIANRLLYWLDAHQPNSEIWAISEFSPNQPVKPWQFAQRNRLVAGLAQATLVIEAGLRSGTFLTATATREQGKELFCLPSPFTSRHAVGAAHLVREGATLITDSQTLAQELKWYHTSHQSRNSGRPTGAAPTSGAQSPLQSAMITHVWEQDGCETEQSLWSALQTSFPQLTSAQWQSALLDLEW